MDCPLFFRFLFFCFQRRSALEITEYVEEEVRHPYVRQCDCEKFCDPHAGDGVEKQILGVADGGQHTSQVCGNGLQHDEGDHLFSQVRSLQQHDGEGNECDEGNVVGDEHGREEAQHDQCGRQLTHFSCPCQQQVCHPVKDP